MLQELSVRLFGNLVISHLDSFSSLKEHMRKAGIQTTLQEYISLVCFASLASYLGFLCTSLIIVTLFFPQAVAFLFAVIVSFLVAGITFALGYSYPSIRAKNLSNRIDKSLPFAVFYMATTASSGGNPLNIFRMLSLRGGLIGEESARIYTNVKTLGMDLVSALERAAARSPSKRFSELLWGMVSILTTGGNLEAYLRGRTKTAMNQYRRALNDYAKSLALYTEIYITLIIVGSIFFIILLAIISPLVGGNTLFLQTFLVFFFIPLVSIGFIMFLKG